MYKINNFALIALHMFEKLMIILLNAYLFFSIFRFRFDKFYELDSLPVVDVRDLGGIKHAFKLLLSPEARLFQCANAEAKKVYFLREIIFTKFFCREIDLTEKMKLCIYFHAL